MRLRQFQQREVRPAIHTQRLHMTGTVHGGWHELLERFQHVEAQPDVIALGSHWCSWRHVALDVAEVQQAIVPWQVKVDEAEGIVGSCSSGAGSEGTAGDRSVAVVRRLLLSPWDRSEGDARDIATQAKVCRRRSTERGCEMNNRRLRG